MNKPLKNKLIKVYTGDMWNVNEKIYYSKDVKSAVEWLKERLDDNQDRELVDEAFPDLK